MIVETIIKGVWRLLPDKCEESDCKRTGVRGNENIIDGKIVCDYCSMKYIQIKDVDKQEEEG